MYFLIFYTDLSALKIKVCDMQNRTAESLNNQTVHKAAGLQWSNWQRTINLMAETQGNDGKRGRA